MNSEILSSFAAHHVGKMVWVYIDPRSLRDPVPVRECEIISVRVLLESDEGAPKELSVSAKYKVLIDRIQESVWLDEHLLFADETSANEYAITQLRQQVAEVGETLVWYEQSIQRMKAPSAAHTSESKETEETVFDPVEKIDPTQIEVLARPPAESAATEPGLVAQSVEMAVMAPTVAPRSARGAIPF